MEGYSQLQKHGFELAEKCEKLPLQDRLNMIAETFGCRTASIRTSPCTGAWRGSSDIFIDFDNGTSLPVGNDKTPQSKTARVRNECVNKALTKYHPEIVSEAKAQALAVLSQREAKDNAIALKQGLKPYRLLGVEFNDGSNPRERDNIGWYYVSLEVGGEIIGHMETGLSLDISRGTVSDDISSRNFYAVEKLKEDDLGFVFDNRSFSSDSRSYSINLSDDALSRAKAKLTERGIIFDKLENVELNEALEMIAENNTFAHLQNDLGISLKQMERAVKMDDPSEKTFIWTSRPYGIDCYSEREAFQKDTSAYNAVIYNADNQSDRQLSYVAEVTEMKHGKVYGNLYEIDLQKAADNIRENAIPSSTVRLYHDDPNDKEQQSLMPRKEYDNSFLFALPKTTYKRHEPDDPGALQERLDSTAKDRELSSKSAGLWNHSRRLDDDRYTYYADKTMQDIGKLPDANSPDKQSFSVTLNSHAANYFGQEELSKLLDALPYENAAFTIQKGQQDMHCVVPRDEVLKERKVHVIHEKPSVLNQLKEAKKTSVQKEKQQKSAPKRDGTLDR